MSDLGKQYRSMIDSMGIPNLSIPLTAVTIYRKEKTIPPQILPYKPDGITLTSCQALKQASLGDPVLLTVDNIGCVAAAITFGLVDQHQDRPMDGSRVYTDLMKEQAKEKQHFHAPSPKDFTEGRVYACKDSGCASFALFGPEDSGRFNSVAIAQKAIADMLALQPAETHGVFFFSAQGAPEGIEPDVVVLNVRPVELTRLIQAYQFHTGKRVESSMGGLRVVNSDLIVRPYLTRAINISPYCLGSRLIAEYEGDRLGMGMPYEDFKEIVRGMADSKTGFPFPMYPDADNTQPF